MGQQDSSVVLPDMTHPGSSGSTPHSPHAKLVPSNKPIMPVSRWSRRWSRKSLPHSRSARKVHKRYPSTQSHDIRSSFLNQRFTGISVHLDIMCTYAEHNDPLGRMGTPPIQHSIRRTTSGMFARARSDVPEFPPSKLRQCIVTEPEDNHGLYNIHSPIIASFRKH